MYEFLCSRNESSYVLSDQYIRAFECRGCIKESLKHSKSCPTCKSDITRRSIESDDVLDGLVSKFAKIEECKNDLAAACRSLAMDERQEGEGRRLVREMMLPWVQGVEDEEYQSPSESFSGAALEELRNDAVKPGSAGLIEDDSAIPPTQDNLGVPGVFSQLKGAHSEDEMTAVGQTSIKEWVKVMKSGTPVTVPESPDEGFQVQQDSKKNVDNILAGLEDQLNTCEKETPRQSKMVLALPATFPSTGSAGTDKENAEIQKDSTGKKGKGGNKRNTSNGSESITKTAKRARASRKAIEQAKTPDTAIVCSEDRRRIPARLLPWSCVACTYENKGNVVECEICGQSKGNQVSHASPNTVEDQRAIEAKAKSSARRRGSKRAANVSHMIESTPQVCVSNCDNKTPVAEMQIDKAAETSQVTLTDVNAKNRKGKKKQSRLAKTVATKKIVEQFSEWSEDDREKLKQIVASASNLCEGDKTALKMFCHEAGPVYSSNWTRNVTHVVCTDSKEPSKTFKYYISLLTGAQLVSARWVKECMRTKSYVPEAEYDVRPKIWRGKNSKDILRDFEVQVQTNNNEVSAESVVELLQAAGAKVAKRMPRSDGQRKGVILVLDAPKGSEDYQDSHIIQEPWFGRACGAKVPVVRQSWLRASIMECGAADIQEHKI